jgi:hypothetical protein
MTLVIADGVEVKTYPPGIFPPEEEVRLCGKSLSMKDFCALAFYVLTNTDLQGDKDPRHRFVEIVKSMTTTAGDRAGLGARKLRAPNSDHSFVYPE